MTTSKKVFSWAEAEQWRADLQPPFYRLLDEPFIQKIRQNIPPRTIIANVHWLNVLLADAYPDQQGKALLAALREGFVKTYHAVRACHGCRVVDRASYTQEGIVPFNPNTYRQAARAAFPTALQTEQTTKEFAEILKTQSQLLYEGEVSFHIDERFILSFAGYYLIYGSHSLFATSINLSRATDIDFKRILAQLGTPTIFVCDIPLSMLPTDTIDTLCKTILIALVEEAVSPQITDCVLAVKNKLPPAFIGRSYHPEAVSDVFYGNDYRRDPNHLP